MADPNEFSQENVLKPSIELPAGISKHVRGYDFNSEWDWSAFLDSFETTGIQADNLHRAFVILEKALKDRVEFGSEFCFYLGYTSNMATSGLRESIRFLLEHKLVDVVVATAGGVEEDLIKCLAPTYVADFKMDDAALRDSGHNRIGNMLVPNNNYCLFEDFVTPILDECLDARTIWTPSQLIWKLGEKIDSPESICYWAYKNQIPIYSPALVDGSLGDMMYFHSVRRPGLILDTLRDLCALNRSAAFAKKTAALVLGGGLVKHQIFNANLMRNGLDYAIVINTSSEFDASDSGASTSEAVSWGKVKAAAEMVKITSDASITFPLIMARVFYLHHQHQRLIHHK